MTEFETQNTVEVVIDDRSLTEAKADVEEALSSVPMDVQASVSGGGGGSGGGGAADEWREQHSLSRERNRLLEELVEAQEEGNFDRAARSAGGLLGGGAAVLGAGALIGVGALSSVLSNFSWPDLPDFEPPGWLPPKVPEPDWHPLSIVEPDPLPIEQPDPLPVEQPDPIPIEEPSPTPGGGPQPADEPGSTGDPSPTPGGDDAPVGDPDPSPAPPPLDDLQDMGDTPSPEPTGAPELSTDGAAEEVGGSTLGKLILGGGAAAAGLEGIRRFGSSAISRAGSAASGGAFLTPEGVGVTDPEAQNRRRENINERTPLELPKIPEDKYSGSVFTAEGRQAQVEGLQSIASRIEDAISNLTDGGDSSDDDSSRQNRNNINIESNVTIDGATRREVERAAEEAGRKAVRDFEQEISRGR